MKYCVAILIISIFSAHVCAQHPGILGEDAPGGREVMIPSDDIPMNGVQYQPKMDKGDKLLRVVIVHGWSPCDSVPLENIAMSQRRMLRLVS